MTSDSRHSRLMNRFHWSAPFSKGDRRNSPITRRPGRDETRVNCLRPPLDDVAIASVGSHDPRRITSAQPDRADRTTRPTPGEFRSVARPSTPLAHDSQHRQVTQRVQFSRGRQPTVGRHRPKIFSEHEEKFGSKPGVLALVTRPSPTRRRLAGGQHAELVVVGIGHDDPRHVALTDVDAPRPQTR